MNTQSTHYIVKASCAKMPASCWGRYRHVAVLEVDDGIENVSMISDRAKGVRRIVAYWGGLFEGKTERCAFRKALAKAHAMADKLNRGEAPTKGGGR